MNKEQIEESEKFFIEQYSNFDYQNCFSRYDMAFFAKNYLESKRSEIERKAYEAGQYSMLDTKVRFEVFGKIYPQPKQTYDQWKESQKKQ